MPTAMIRLLNVNGNVSDMDNLKADIIKSVEVSFLAVVSLLGVLGNLLVIFSVFHSRAVHRGGNEFLINLAFADLLVTGICMPMIIPNVVRGSLVISESGCKFLGFMLIASIASSFLNLAYIAVQRYCIVAHFNSFSKIITRRRLYLMIALNWFWAIVLASVAFSDRIGLGYSNNTMVCSWNSSSSKIYNYTLMLVAYWIPLAIAVTFYIKLYKSVRRQDKSLQRFTDSISIHASNAQREIRLSRTIVITIVVSLLFWLPRAFVEIMGRSRAGPVTDKVTSWVAISNSSINFIVYGATNPAYRRRFKRFLLWLFCHQNHGIRSRLSLRSTSSFGGRMSFTKHRDTIRQSCRCHVKHEDTICKPHLEGSNMNFVKATNTSSTNVQE